MRQSRRTEGTYQKPKKQTVAFASTKKADSTRLRFVTHLHPRFRLSCNHYTQENLFRKDKEKQKSNICSCFYFFLLHLPLQSCIYFFIQRFPLRILLKMNIVHIMKKAITTKEKILENAKKEARSKGLEKIGMREISSASSVALGTLYNYSLIKNL